jgi:hypothetical protein
MIVVNGQLSILRVLFLPSPQLHAFAPYVIRRAIISLGEIALTHDTTLPAHPATFFFLATFTDYSSPY